MKIKLTNLMRKPDQAALLMIVALVLPIVLAATVWAARSMPLHVNWAAALEAHSTATPTKTPRPFTPTPTLAKVELVAVAPAATGSVPPGAVTPPAEVTPGQMPAYLAVVHAGRGATADESRHVPGTSQVPGTWQAIFRAEIVARYGMDPRRRFIIVDPERQRMTIWDPGQPVRELPVSTGDPQRGYRTPAWYGLVGEYWGTFHAFGVYADEGWYLFQDTGSILIHGAPYKLVNGNKVYLDLDALGSYPASRGCIRLRPEDARWFTEWGPQGVPLVILP